MKCREAQPNLMDYSRGLLTPIETEAIGKHLDTCEECRAVLRSEAELSSRLASVPAVAPAADVWTQVQSRIHAERRPVWLVGVDFGVYARRLVATAAAVVVLIAAVFITAPWSPGQAEKDSAVQATALMQVQPANQPFDDQLTRTTDDMMRVIDSEL